MNRLQTMVLVAVIAMLAVPALGATSGTSTSSSVNQTSKETISSSDSWAKTVNTNTDVNTKADSFNGGSSSSSQASALQVFAIEQNNAFTWGNAYGTFGVTVSNSDAKSDSNANAGASSNSNGVFATSGGNSWSVLGFPNEARANAWDVFISGNGNSAANASAKS